ncbi:MAG: glutamine--fructose-6-phosphate transaminase (isomerizing) [Planctomycetota bacterium]
MCGIVGYTGPRAAAPILLEGLKRLEYRGYDSAGVALVGREGLEVVKCAGRVEELARRLGDVPSDATLGIAHTRWATHGAPTAANAHPHTDGSGRVAVVHNGIIENHASLRKLLEAEGVSFRSETDTETLAHLVARFYAGDLADAVRSALVEVRGTYGLVVVHADHPDELVVARDGSPVLIGVGEGEFIVASDAAAILSHTSRVMYLGDGEVARITRRGIEVRSRDDAPISKEIEQLEIRLEEIEMGGYPHFMLKEIHEQPESLENTLRGRLDLAGGEVVLGGLKAHERELARIERLVLVGCGTAWHAALVGEYLIEDLARLPVEVEYASEFRYRNPVLGLGTAVMAVSQSGETADTLAAVREAKRRGALALGCVNVVGSSVARETDAGVYLHAGPEIGVASTKAFTSQLGALAMFAIFLGRQRHLAQERLQALMRELAAVPAAVREVLRAAADIRRIAQDHADRENWLYLGRGELYPVALEGALKLKEISYIHAEGLPAAEMKHGPIALITKGMPVVVIVNDGPQCGKILNNIEEVRSRGGRIIAVASSRTEEIEAVSERLVVVPKVNPLFQPIVSVVPLQLLAYYAAVARGCPVDKPRNLAKSVTVE